MARKRKLPTAADFFGGEEAEEKQAEQAADEDILAKTMDEDEPEEPAPTRKRGPKLTRELLLEGSDEDFAAAIEAEKAAMAAAFEPRPRVIPQIPGEKVTFYVPLDMVKQLEVIKVRLLMEHNLKVTRSQIVEVLLEGMGEKVEEIAAALGGTGE